MKKQPEFRILEVQKGGLTTYQAQVKKRWWWRSFYISHRGNVKFYYSPSRSKSVELGYIEEYKMVKEL